MEPVRKITYFVTAKNAKFKPNALRIFFDVANRIAKHILTECQKSLIARKCKIESHNCSKILTKQIRKPLAN